jgi:hypothetical protein
MRVSGRHAVRQNNGATRSMWRSRDYATCCRSPTRSRTGSSSCRSCRSPASSSANSATCLTVRTPSPINQGQAQIMGLGGPGPYFSGGPFEKCLLPDANFLTVFTAKGDSFHVFLPSKALILTIPTVRGKIFYDFNRRRRIF